MAIEDNISKLFIVVIAVLIIARFLGSIDATLAGELNNTAAHPNGPLALALIGFIVVAVALGALITAFKIGKGALEDARNRFRPEE